VRSGWTVRVATNAPCDEYCLHLLNGMFTVFLYARLCICFNVVCMYDFMLNV
jgi:hypothetical protein